MAMTYHKRPNFQRGDKVQLRHCPRWPSLETHAARVTGDPYFAFGRWEMPVRYQCLGFQNAIVDCDDAALIRRGYKLKLSKPAIVTAVILFVVFIFGMSVAGNYNSLVKSSNDVDNSWAKVETQYQRRFDLIGNLVESVKGSQYQELAVFKAIADGRKTYQAATTPEAKAEAAASIETNVALVPRLQEAYPELKSNANIQSLMAELTSTENGIAGVRNTYNDTANNYNITIKSFPKNIYANLFGYNKPRALFRADKEAASAPKVNFNSVNRAQ